MPGETPTKESSTCNVLVENGRKTRHPELKLCSFDLQTAPNGIFQDPFPACLQLLDLRNNVLVSLCDEICRLSNLETLILSGNCLTELPREIGELRKLVTFDLSRNNLKFLCKEINNLKELKAINLSGNDLKELPKYLLCLPKLTRVFCIRNKALSNIPREIAAEGLEAMRDYLNIKVEEYECVTEKRKKDRHLKKEFDFLLSEIEKQWTLDDEQYIRKTKDACTQLDEEESSILQRNGLLKLKGRLSPERSSSTQTDEKLEFSQSPLMMKDFPSDKQYHPSIEYGTSTSSLPCSTENVDVTEQLVKIFRKQLGLVADCKTQFLLKIGNKGCHASNSSCNLSINNSYSKTSRRVGCCHGCGLRRRREMLTSEYGSMSSLNERDTHHNILENDADSCDGNDGSRHDDVFSDTELDDLDRSDTSDSSDENAEGSWATEQYRYINACRELVVKQQGIEMRIPEMNVSGHKQKDFAFEMLNEVEFAPVLSPNSVLASPIVSATPHGAKFYTSMHATVRLPLHIVIEDGVEVHCYESNTDADELPSWKEINPGSFEVMDRYVLIKTNHFSLFCAAASRDYPCIQNNVSPLNGGCLSLPEVPGLEVIFQGSCVQEDIEASMTVLYDDERYTPAAMDKPMASPIIALGPSGTSFDDDVKVTLPLPDAQEVCKIVQNLELVILESQSELEQETSWRQLNVPYEIQNQNGVYCVTFKVRHFTLFAAFWNMLETTFKKVKRGATNFVPQFKHIVYFQALMSDYGHNKDFGLCILCHLSSNPPVTDCSQFPIEVGRSKPRELKTGEMEIELKSTLFCPNLNVGESKLIATENFIGRDFDKQFALQFHDQFRDGTFGKVYITKKEESGVPEKVVDFLLQKACKNLASKIPTERETMLLGEFAGMLSIEDRWKELGITLGYTRREVNSKFDTEDPIKEILTDYLSRDGECEKFIKAMYEVARRLKLIPYDQMMENRENRRTENRTALPLRFCTCPPTPEDTPLRTAKRKLTDCFEVEVELTEAKLDQLSGEIAKSWKHVARNLGVGEKKIAEIDLNNQNEGEREKAFQIFMVWREMDPDNFNGETLGRALYKCDLKFTARQFLGY